MRKVILLICSLFVCSASWAQLTIGPKAGINIASWSTTYTNLSSRIAYHLGGFATNPISDKLDIQAELMFSSMGPKNESNSSPGRIVSNYISVPVLAVFHPKEEISVYGGLQFSFLLSATTVVTSGANEGSYDDKDLFNSSDFAFVLGGHYQFSEKIQAGLRVNIGLNDIDPSNEDSIKNTVFQIYAAFPLFSFE
jgi:hypothetical protein